MQPSPYTPGEVARGVPGRAVQVAQADERLAYLVDLQRLVGRVRVDVAARGIGKTSLLREIQRRAEARGALTVWVTAGEQAGLVAALADEIARRTAEWHNETLGRLREALGRLTFTVGVPGVATVEARFGRDEQPPTHGVREFEAVVRRTVEAAHKEDRTGLVLFVDEIQSADPAGLRTLAYAWQHLQSEGQDVPAAVFAAGLPNAPEVIASVVTFSERFAYRPLQRLDDDATMVALAGPSRALGVWWDDEALAAALTEVQGYPYSVQLLGDAVWTAAGLPGPRRGADPRARRGGPGADARRPGRAVPGAVGEVDAGRAAVHARHGRARRRAGAPRRHRGAPRRRDRADLGTAGPAARQGHDRGGRPRAAGLLDPRLRAVGA